MAIQQGIPMSEIYGEAPAETEEQSGSIAALPSASAVLGESEHANIKTADVRVECAGFILDRSWYSAPQQSQSIVVICS